MKRTLARRIAATTAAAALALGVAACEVEDGDLDPLEDPFLDDGLEGDM